MENQGIEKIKDYIRLCRLSNKKGRLFYDYILKNGEGFENPKTKIDEKLKIKFGVKQCYYNNQLIMIYTLHKKYRYFEGWLFDDGLIPLEHSWIVDKEGNCIDVTLPLTEKELRKIKKNHKIKRVYFGVEIPSKFIKIKKGHIESILNSPEFIDFIKKKK